MLVIVGYGEHVQRNVLPAISRVGGIAIKFVVVRDPSKYSSVSEYSFSADYESVLQDSDVTAVYIATPISTHYEYAKKAIEAGKHVLCEKSMTDNEASTKSLIALSNSFGVKLQEVVMYQYHDQFSWLRAELESTKLSDLRKVHARFQIPRLSEDNIRYTKALGGGALLDVGFYPISVIASLFGRPLKVNSFTSQDKGYEVDLSGASLFDYESFYCLAEWGIGRLYRNEVLLEFENYEILIERAFSKPHTLDTVITRIGSNGEVKKIVIPADDQFGRLFADFFSSTEINISHLREVVLRAELIDQLKAQIV